MVEIQVDGENVSVSVDIESGLDKVKWSSGSFEMSFPDGTDKIFVKKLNETRKDGTPKFDVRRKEIFAQDFIIGHMKKVKDVCVTKNDFWRSYQAFRSMLENA
jgi:hypothetical protein